MKTIGTELFGRYFATYGNWKFGINIETGAVYHARMPNWRDEKIQVDISLILGNLITVIFDYQIPHKPLKILSL